MLSGFVFRVGGPHPRRARIHDVPLARLRVHQHEEAHVGEVVAAGIREALLVIFSVVIALQIKCTV